MLNGTMDQLDEEFEAAQSYRPDKPIGSKDAGQGFEQPENQGARRGLTSIDEKP